MEQIYFDKKILLKDENKKHTGNKIIVITIIK